jgi:hypothetical protein
LRFVHHAFTIIISNFIDKQEVLTAEDYVAQASHDDGRLFHSQATGTEIGGLDG